ncbi:uncharacterized protein [Aegilops tauschii subsp. strangulata]|uniref:DUF4220 domain-containing protein n=1 Tax=Aegilops tauschii subsp. strangulata TaxID=200361 RepID=A0A453AK34_AEGTS|nr:uncharacterized protein LOC120973417 [Aegilops tauschii subsp. strangulata]
MSSIGIVQSAVKKVQQVGVDFVQVQVVASAVLAILVVALSAYGRRCRHPALRLIISGASIAFIPLTSSAINALLGQRKMLKLLKECEDPTCKGGKYSPEVQTMWTLLLWSVLILIIKGNADTAAASAAAASASPSSGDVGVDGQKVRTPVELLATYAVVVWLIVECIPEAEWLKFEGKAIFVVFFLLGFAKVVLKLVAFLMASNSYAIGKNARLVSGYMAQLVEEGAEDGHGHVPPYLVVGESKEHVEEKPQGYRIKRESDPVKKNKDKLGALITLDRVWTLSDHGDGFLAKKLELRDLCLSFSLFKSLRRRLSGYPLTEEGSSNALDFVLRGMDTAAGDGKAGVDAKRVFRVLVDELWFASDFYYSPLPLCSFSGWCAALNYLLSVLIIAGAIGVGVLYQIRRVIVVGPDRAKENPAKGPELYQVAYYFITLFLLLAAVLTEACEIIAGVCSNWTKMALIGHYIRSGTLGRWTNAALDTVLRFRPAKRWSDEIGQTSVLEPRRFGRRSGLFSEKLYGRAGLMRSVEVSQAVKDAVLRSLKSSYGGLDKGSTLAAHRVGLGGKVDSWAWPAIGAGSGSGTSSTTEHILACHIGARLFEIKYSNAACPTLAAADMTAACHLSYYCAYLVAASPGLLPDSPAWTDKRYKEVVADVKAALGKDDDGASESTAQRYERLLKELSATSRDEVLQRGAELGSRLVEAHAEDEAAAWRFLADFWSEMVLFVAPSKNVKGHVEAMGRGGEFVTLVWALLMHAGVTDRPGTADGTGVP